MTALTELGVVHDFGVTATEDAAVFVNELANHQVVVFMNTTGDVLDASQQTAFEDWYRSGKGFVGIHAASDTESGWPWYLDLVGAQFSDHPPGTSPARVEFLDQVHPITNVTDPSTGERVLNWTVTDEWYNFVESPRGEVHVLAQVDEDSYAGGSHGDDHPIAWCHQYDGGRSAYLALGHPSELFSNGIYRDLMVNMVEWAAGELGGDSGATIDANYEKVILDDDVSQPMAIDVAEDGRVFLVERAGAVKVHDQDTGVTTTIGNLDAYTGGEFGVLGLALSPDFSVSENLYINWSPNPAASNLNRVSRFTLDPSGDLDMSSEAVILECYLNRPSETGNNGHHVGGGIRFDGDGNLYIGIGDNTDAYNWSPRNETSIGLDSRKGSPNTNDLRGKILRITPNVGGGPVEHPNYTIPDDNLFPVGTPLTRPEIYVMGCRNNFRFCIDPYTDWLYFGDVGPDANSVDAGAYGGPLGHDEFNQVKEAGWFGWPYYIADGQAYFDGSGTPWTVTTMEADLADYFENSSGFLGSLAEVGDPTLLGEPEPAWIWYTDFDTTSPDQFSELGSVNRSAMAGQVYAHQPGHNFPEYFDGSLFIMEFMRNLILEVKTNPDGSIHEITRFAPNLSFSRPIDMQFGPDGAMYVIEWGSSWSSGTSGDTRLIKVQYLQAQSTPVAVASANVTEGDLPLTVDFSSAGSVDPDGTALTYAWDFDGDQVNDSTEENPTHVYTVPGVYSAILTVTDEDELFSRSTITINVGNNRPVVAFIEPAASSFYDWGDTVEFEFTVVDAEDGSSAGGQITEADVFFETALGHVDHLHSFGQYNLLAGQILIARDDSHGFDDDLSISFDASYTDEGAIGTESLTGTARRTFYPKVTMAQVYNGQSGTATTLTGDLAGGGVDVTDIDDSDYIYFSDRNLIGIGAIRLRAASGDGGTVEIREGSPSGNLIGEIIVAPGDGKTYLDYTGSISGVSPGSQDIYFVFTNSTGGSDLMKLNWINFRGGGVTLIPNRPVVSEVDLAAPNQLRVTFDQEMDLATMGNTLNYTIDRGAMIVDAVPSPDQKTVILVLGNAFEGSYYTVTMSGIEDLAGDQMAAGSEFMFLNLTTEESQFMIGLNGGGPDYTDSMGHLYVADSSGPNEAFAGTVLVNFAKGSGSTGFVQSTASSFQAVDPDVSLTAPVNTVTTRNGTGISLQGEGVTGVTLSLSGSSVPFNTDKGSYVGQAIVDSYFYEGADFGASGDGQLVIAGLGDIDDGQTIRLTLWGVGDTADSDCTFELVYNGSIVGTQTTDYETPSNAYVQFSFDKVAGQDSIMVNWGKGGSSTTGLNGFCLTSVQEAGSYLTQGGRTANSSDAIANTLDDELYQTERWHRANNDFSYAVPVPNGSYEVLLRFAEVFYQEDEKRAFNVHIEGSGDLFSPDLDIHSLVGHDTAYDYLVENIEVSDGMLDMTFVDTGVDNPKVSAVGIFQVVNAGIGYPDPSFAKYLLDNPESQLSGNLDIDGDGLVTLMEYALGLDDEVHDSGDWLDFAKDEDDFLMSFTRPEDLPDILYTVEASDRLDGGWRPVSPVEVTSPMGGGMEEVRFEGLSAAAVAAGLTETSHCFFRLRVDLMDVAPAN